MNDTHKLLLAMCEALDLDVETIHSKTYGHARKLTFNEMSFEGGARPEMEFQGEGLYKEVTRHVDYKVTKKEPEYILHKFVIDEPVKTHIITFECDISSNNDTRK